MFCALGSRFAFYIAKYSREVFIVPHMIYWDALLIALSKFKFIRIINACYVCIILFIYYILSQVVRVTLAIWIIFLDDVMCTWVRTCLLYREVFDGKFKVHHMIYWDVLLIAISKFKFIRIINACYVCIILFICILYFISGSH